MGDSLKAVPVTAIASRRMALGSRRNSTSIVSPACTVTVTLAWA